MHWLNNINVKHCQHLVSTMEYIHTAHTKILQNSGYRFPTTSPSMAQCTIVVVVLLNSGIFCYVKSTKSSCCNWICLRTNARLRDPVSVFTISYSLMRYKTGERSMPWQPVSFTKLFSGWNCEFSSVSWLFTCKAPWLNGYIRQSWLWLFPNTTSLTISTRFNGGRPQKWHRRSWKYPVGQAVSVEKKTELTFQADHLS